MKRKVGRPSILTEEKLEKLKDALMLGMNLKKASEYAGLKPQSVYDCKYHDPKLSEKIDRWRKDLEYKARYAVAKAIDNGDSKIALDYLKHTCEEFKAKNTVELSGAGGGPLVFTWQSEGGEDAASNRDSIQTEEDMARNSPS